MINDDLIVNKSNKHFVSDNRSLGSNVNDFCGDVVYKGADGLEYSTIEAVEEANKTYWGGMMIDTSLEDFARRAEAEKARLSLERERAAYFSSIGGDDVLGMPLKKLDEVNTAYFDYLSSIFNINSENITEKIFDNTHDKMLSYIQESYKRYITGLLESYSRKDKDLGPKL